MFCSRVELPAERDGVSDHGVEVAEDLHFAFGEAVGLGAGEIAVVGCSVVGRAEVAQPDAPPAELIGTGGDADYAIRAIGEAKAI